MYFQCKYFAGTSSLYGFSVKMIILWKKIYSHVASYKIFCENKNLIDEVFFRNRELAGNLSESENDDHYFLFKTDSINCFVYGISNPCIKKDESWIRLINRSFGTELVPPRRKFVEKLVYK